MESGENLRAEKRQLRREVQGRMRSMQDAARRAEGSWVSQRLLALAEAQGARTVMTYWAMPDELPVTAFVEAWHAAGKRIVLPVVKGDDLELYEYTGRECLVAVPPYNILEPHGTRRVAPEEVELVVVPGVAFDAQGGRMGHGKGFYDRLFPHMPSARLVGVCLRCQLVERIPMESHDRRMDCIVCQNDNER